MSESMNKLADRVKKLQDSASAASEKNRAELSERRQAIEQRMDTEVAASFRLTSTRVFRDAAAL